MRTRPRASLVPRTLYVGARRTSVRLEPVMWEALVEIAEHRGRSVHDLVTEISAGHDAPNLSAAIRVHIVEFYRERLRSGATVRQPASDRTITILPSRHR